ncbi:anti-sigma factor family protein [Allosphingosinicella indica]|uniref:Transmembrane transcriptional regulator (Anti-sigma factor RsiW) n=1 Tax=Allosphingosinicella indica TaxID=941907 RepID=A0A1X7GCC4_9SPHN|nr:hypothetical protein [Allosphingosinicella indica]SMF67557.1 Transmembrane transcriptional regulator (anti-sigma factor RsiW) [Allosphingosinicella indica]
MRPESIEPIELEAYVDDQLDLARRMAVEERLAHDPELAASVMADLRARSALRLLARAEGPVPSGLGSAADRLDRRLAGKPRSRLFRPLAGLMTSAAAVVLLMIAVNDGPAQAEPPPYVADALMAYRTGMLRAGMESLPQSRVFDAGEVMRATRIRMPVLPEGWTVRDVQIFPSDEGPALQIMVDTAEEDAISIFAIHAGSDAPATPVVIDKGAESVAYWRNGDISYALTGAAAPEALDIAARDLADNRLR